MLVDSTVSKTLRVVVTVTVFAASLYVVYRVRTVILWLLIGAFLAIIINPLVSWVSRYMPKKRRGLGVAVVLTFGVIVTSVLVAIFITPVAKQGAELIQNWPEITSKLNNNLQYSEQQPYVFLREQGIVDYFENNQDVIKNSIESFFGSSLKRVGSALSSIGALFTIAAMTVYTSVNGVSYATGMKKLLPKKHRKDVEQLAEKMYGAVTGYVNGNLLTSAIAGVAGGVAAAAVGLPYPALQGLVIAITDLIPMVGATLGATIVVAVALFTSINAAIIMAVFFAIYQLLENYVLVPRVMGKTVEMSSFAVFVAALTGGVLAGFIGALVAIPIGACVQILLQYGLKKRGIGT